MSLLLTPNYIHVIHSDMNMEKARSYQMSKRAESTAQTSEQIIRSLGLLWLKYSLHEITLEKVAENAGVTVRTLLRKFGSKEGLFEAAIQSDPVGIISAKDQVATGDVTNAIQVLLQDYERTGMAVIRTLAIENELPIAKRILQKGRASHMEWCRRVFSPFLPSDKSPKYDFLCAAIYSATDVYVWKLLRKDLKYSELETKKIIELKVHALITQGKLK